MKTEIERARESIKEYRKGYGQPQLPTDCIIQLMMGHAKSEQLILSGVIVPKGTVCEITEWDGKDEANLCDCGKGEGNCKKQTAL